MKADNSQDIYLHVIPKLVKVLDAACKCHGMDESTSLQNFERLHAVAVELQRLVQFARRTKKTLQPRNEDYLMKKPTISLQPVLKDFVASLEDQIAQNKQRIGRAKWEAELPARRERSKNLAEQERDQKEAETRTKKQRMLEAQARSLANTQTWLSLPPSITRSMPLNSFESCATAWSPDVVEAPVQSETSSPRREFRHPATFEKNEGQFMDVDDDDDNERQSEFHTPPEMQVTQEQRLSMLGSKNTNEAAVGVKWTEHDWDILIEGLMQHVGKLSPAALLTTQTYKTKARTDILLFMVS